MRQLFILIRRTLLLLSFSAFSYRGQAQLSLLRDINPGAQGSSSQGFRAAGNNLLFLARDGVHGNELWQTDGTPGGTQLVKDIFPGIDGMLNVPSFVPLDNYYIFSTNSYLSAANKQSCLVERTDGTGQGTYTLLDVSALGLNPSVSGMNAVGNLVLFIVHLSDPANPNIYYDQLWKTDGTVAGTQKLKTPDPTGATGITFLSNVGGTLYLATGDASTGQELWKTDGTAAGTTLLRDINPGTAASMYYPQPVVVGNTIFFSADDGVHGLELWKSDGTAGGTVMVKDINPGTATSSPLLGTVVNGTLFFTANDGIHGNELWKSDGTDAGTVMVKDILPGVGDIFSGPGNLMKFNDLLVFLCDDGVHGPELWKSDGTTGGTVMIKDVDPNNISYPYQMTMAGNRIFFSEDDNVHGTELWMTDGTEAGTVMVKDINPGGDYTDFGYSLNFAAYKNSIFFPRINPITGITELWTSDGTVGGTVPVYNGANVTSFIINNDIVYATVDDPNVGNELFVGPTNPPKQDQTISFDPLPAKTYGDPNFLLSAISSDGLLINYTSSDPTIAQITGGNQVQIMHAGTVTITASQSGSLGFNPAPDVTQSLTINKAPLTITAENKRKVVGEPNPLLDATYIGFVNYDDASMLTTPVTLTTSADINSPVGPYPIIPSAATADNYNISFVNGRLYVAAAPLIPQTITFDAPPVRSSSDPDFDPGAFASSGLPVIYTTSDPTVAVIVNGRVHLTGAGTVDIIASQSGDDFYDVALPVTQTLTVSISNQTISFFVLPEKTYGDPVFDAGAVASSGLGITYTSSDPSVAMITDDNKIRITGAGTVIITATQSGNNAYTPAEDAAQTLTIGKAGLTIRAEDKTKVQGQLNPVLTTRITGLAYNDDAASFTTPPDISTSATPASLPGEYPIILSGATSPNYDVHLINGKLTVTPSLQGHTTLAAWFSSSSVLQVTLYVDSAQKAMLQLLDAKGAILIRQEVEAAKGVNNYTIPCGNWPAGAYILQAIGERFKLDKKMLKTN